MDKQEQKIRAELDQLQRQMQSPDVFGRTNYPQLAKRQGELAKILELFDEQRALKTQLADAQKMAGSADTELAGLARAELGQLQEKLTKIEEQLSESLLPKNANDQRDVIVEIRAAAGGDEASLFAGELYRMYLRWCEKNRYKAELISESPAESGGFKEIIFIALLLHFRIFKIMKPEIFNMVCCLTHSSLQ